VKNRKIRGALLAVGVIGAAAVAAALWLVPRRTLTTTSASARRDYLAGMEDMQRVYLRDAEQRFESAVSKDPDFAMALVALAYLREPADPKGARELLARADRMRDRLLPREKLIVELAQADVRGNWQEAGRVAQILKDEYEEPRAYMYLAKRATEQGQTSAAEAIYREWLENDPNAAPAYNYLGYAAAYRGDFDTAIANLKKYAFMAPDEANPFDSLGEIQCAAGRYDEAIAELERAIRIKPDFEAAYEHLGLAFEGKGDLRAARANFEKAYAMYPGGYPKFLAGYQLYLLALRQKDFAAARDVIARLTQLGQEPARSAIPFLEAALESEEGHYQEALARLAEFRAPPGDDSKYASDYEQSLRLLHGRIEFNAGHYRAAAELISSALADPGRNRSISEMLGMMRYRALLARALAHLGDLPGAERLIQVNRRINPNYPETTEAAAEIAGMARGK
jgi:tetratricopeptide (TPR) repeat protein